jgi:Tol biopolymer transport system component
MHSDWKKGSLTALAVLALASLSCNSISTPSTSTLISTAAPSPVPPIPTPVPGRYGTFTMRLDGTELRQIYSTDLSVGGLRPSADGSQFLFQFFYRDVNGDGQFSDADMSALEIGLLNMDGTNFRRLTEDNFIDALPAWSPNGTEILFTSNRGDGEKLDLFVMNIDGQIVHQLTQTPDVHEGDPDWIGDTIVYTYSAEDEEVQSIWAMAPDGTGARQVTFPPARDKSDLAFKYGDFDPNLSPDGQQVAFERQMDDDFFFVDRQIGRWDVFIASTGGGEERNLTNEEEAAGFPKWSPDGQTILFLSHRVEAGKPLIALYTIDATGSNRREVHIPLRNVAPLSGEWLPDGEHIIFAVEIYR